MHCGRVRFTCREGEIVPPDPARAAPLLQARGITKHFGAITALSGVEFHVAAGEVLRVAPPSETDVQAQISQLEALIAQKVDGIALAPTDPNALAAVVDSAKEAGVNVVF